MVKALSWLLLRTFVRRRRVEYPLRGVARVVVRRRKGAVGAAARPGTILVRVRRK